MSDQVTLRESDHTYWSGGAKLPGFHEILDEVIQKAKYYKNPTFYASRGRAVHQAIALLEDGTLDKSTVDQEHVAPFIRSYEKFKSEHRLSPFMQEEIVMHPRLMYCGTLDFFGELDGEQAFIDFKCGQPEPPFHALQLTAYRDAIGSEVKTGYGLYLRSDNKYKLVPYDLDEHSAAWEHIVQIYWWRKNEKI